ncbi:MAG TPA: choice-of-anchor tandem repeat GloVer-containing protein [Candidatus Saccharimonadales bacterium]|nr:choice-of-anchor tandem repeat GloVer-containing protein [Candidatus Saccharimonadales bacterium]
MAKLPFREAVRTGITVLAAAASLVAPSSPAQTPSIVSITPSNGQTVPVTFTAMFSVAVTNASSKPFGYEWYFDNQQIVGASHNVLNVINSQQSNAGTYFVVVTNSFGGTTSGPITLTVTNEASQLTNLVFNTVASLATGSSGDYSQNSLVQGRNGNIYGTAYLGGAQGYGTVFSLNTNGVFSWVIALDNIHGSYPSAGLVSGPDGTLYGTTAAGGAFDWGTVFSVTPAGDFHSIYSFTGKDDGINPQANLVFGADGYLYSTTQAGPTNAGIDRGYGTVFKVSTNGTLIWSFAFNLTNGFYPLAGLVQGADGNFYGTTFEGGTNNIVNGGNGTIFVINSNGVFTNLYSFKNGADGANPYASLAQGSDGNFYGTTYSGGTNSEGAIFKITPRGVLTPLVSFNGTNGSYPEAALLLAADGNFYGTTFSGGLGFPATSYGTLFQMTPSGGLTTLVSFNGNYDGAFPYVGVIQGSDGGLYGTTSEGGVNDLAQGGDGAIFRVGFLAPFLQSVVRSGSTISFTWNSMAGESYQVQYTSDLTQSTWTNLGAAVFGTNGVGGASDTLGAGNAPRFYRVIQQ